MIEIGIEVETETVNGTVTETGAEAEVAPSHESARGPSDRKTSRWTTIWHCNYCLKRARR